MIAYIVKQRIHIFFLRWQIRLACWRNLRLRLRHTYLQWRIDMGDKLP